MLCCAGIVSSEARRKDKPCTSHYHSIFDCCCFTSKHAHSTNDLVDGVRCRQIEKFRPRKNPLELNDSNLEANLRCDTTQ